MKILISYTKIKAQGSFLQMVFNKWSHSANKWKTKNPGSFGTGALL
jgi:hypothetical protein